MKQLLIFIFTIFSVLLNAIDFAPIGAKWHYTRHTLNPNYETYGTIESIADTLIAGKVCQKLKEATTSTANWVVYSNDDSVFVYRDGKFKLLYDFGAMQGDTVTLGFSGANGTLKMIILSNSTIILKEKSSKELVIRCICFHGLKCRMMALYAVTRIRKSEVISILLIIQLIVRKL